MDDLRRLEWQCRRGTLELDLLVLRYLNTRYSKAPFDEQRAFRRLLDLPDPELYTLLTCGDRSTDKDVMSVVEHILTQSVCTS